MRGQLASRHRRQRFAYDVGGLVRIESEIEVPALHNFASASLWHPHVIVRSADSKAVWPLTRSSRDLIAPEAASAVGIHVNMGDPIEVQLRPARHRIERDVHGRVVVALVRWLLVSRRYVFVHAAALTRNGRAVLISTRPDDGNAGFRLRRTSGYRSLSRDVAILSPGGPLLCYPNPVAMLIEDATPETQDAPSRERISLDIRTETDGSQTASRLGRLLAGARPPAGRPAAAVLVMVPPLIPEADAIPNAGAGSASRIDHVFLFARGEPGNRELTLDEGVAQLLDHTDLAYGLPPRSPLAVDGYAELLQREGVLLWEALQRSSMRQVLVPGRGQADIFPRLVLAPLPALGEAAHAVTPTPPASAWGPLLPSTDLPTRADSANGDIPTRQQQEAAGSGRSMPRRVSRPRGQKATKPSAGDKKKAPRAASPRTSASSPRKRATKAAAALGSKVPRSSRSRSIVPAAPKEKASKPSTGDTKAPRAASPRTSASSPRKRASKAAAALGSKVPRSSRSRSIVPAAPKEKASKPSTGDTTAPRAASPRTSASSSRKKRTKVTAAIGPTPRRPSPSRSTEAAAAGATQVQPSVGRMDGPSSVTALVLPPVPTALTATAPITAVPLTATGVHARRTRFRARLPAARWPRWAVAPFRRWQAWRANVRTVPAVAVITVLVLMPTLASSDASSVASVEFGVQATSGGSRMDPLHVQEAFDGLREGSPVVGWAVTGGTLAETEVTGFPNAGDRSLRIEVAEAGRAVRLCKMGRFVEPVAVSLDFLIRGRGASDRIAIELPSGSRTLVEASATLGRGLTLRAGSATYSVDRGIDPEVWYRSTLTFDSSTWAVSWMIDDRASRTPILRTPPVPLDTDLGVADGICLSVRAARVTDLFFLDNVRV